MPKSHWVGQGRLEGWSKPKASPKASPKGLEDSSVAEIRPHNSCSTDTSVLPGDILHAEIKAFVTLCEVDRECQVVDISGVPLVTH
ncbi:hypothetical protein ACFX2G_031354 [Malus domestica]